MIKLTACGVPLRAEFNKISVFTLAFIYRQATIFDGNQNKDTVRFFLNMSICKAKQRVRSKKHATKKIREMKNDKNDSLWTTLEGQV